MAIQWSDVRREVRDSLPIGTAATVPAAILMLAWEGLLNAQLVLALPLAATDLGLAFLGCAVEWF